MTGQVVEDLAEELAQRWAPLFERIGWPERLELLHQMHEQLQEDLDDLEMYCAVSPVLTRKIIEKVSGGPITSAAQAHIYANSADENHRHAAGDWLSLHQGSHRPGGVG